MVFCIFENEMKYVTVNVFMICKTAKCILFNSVLRVLLVVIYVFLKLICLEQLKCFPHWIPGLSVTSHF